MTLTEIIQVFKKRWWLIGSGALVAGLVAAVLSLLWQPSYEAQASLLITKLRSTVTLDTRFPTVAEENVVNLSVQDEQVRRQTLVELASSSQIAASALDRLGDELSPAERTVSALSDMVSVDTAGNVITFRARADSPAKAAAVANAWAEVYETCVNKLYSTTSPTAEQIQVEMASAQSTYQQAEVNLEDLIRSSTELELTRQIEQKKGILAGLQAGQLAATRQRVDQLLQRSGRIDQLLLDVDALRAQLQASQPATEPSPGEQMALYYLETGALAQTVFYSATLELGQPVMLQEGLTTAEALDQLDRLTGALQGSRAAVRTEIAAESAALLKSQELLIAPVTGEGSIAALQAQISALEADLQQQTWKKQVLLDEQTLARDTYMTVARKAAEVQLLTEITSLEVQIASPATEPDEPSFPRPLLSIVLSIVAGGLLGLVPAFLLEFWHAGSSPSLSPGQDSETGA